MKTDKKKMEYYNNKILYALNKIEYAKSRLTGKPQNNALAKIYGLLITYQGELPSTSTVARMTGLSEKEVDETIKLLKNNLGLLLGDLGVEISTKKADFRTWLIELHKKLAAQEGVQSYEKLQPSCEEIAKQRPREQIVCGDNEDDIVEIIVDNDTTIRTKKRVLLDKLLRR